MLYHFPFQVSIISDRNSTASLFAAFCNASLPAIASLTSTPEVLDAFK